jgi:outer membrane protein TolC
MNAVTVALWISLSQAPGQTPAQTPETPTPSAQPAPGDVPTAAPPSTTAPTPQLTPELPPPTSRLTLPQALAEAEARNLDIRQVNARFRQADEYSWQAWSYYLPQARATGTYIHNQREIAFDLGPPLGEVTLQAKNQLQGQIDFSQMIFSPSLWFAIQGANKGENVARAASENGRRAIRFGVAQAFYGVAALGKARSVAERLLEIAQRQEKDAQVRFKAGTIAKVGLLRAEIDRARAEQDLKRAQNAYKSGVLTLAVLLDRKPDFEVVEPPDPVTILDRVELENRALRDRADVQAARANVDLAHADRNANVAGYLPNVTAFGRYSIANAAGFTGSDVWLGGLALSWNLLDGGLRESKIRQGNARIDEADAALKKAEVTARDDVRQALLDLDSARANTEKSKEQRDLAAENQRLVDVSFKAGAATAVEQADATAALRNAEFGLQVDMFNYQVSVLRVLQAAGVAGPLEK